MNRFCIAEVHSAICIEFHIGNVIWCFCVVIKFIHLK
jgi:hypothetical protein